MIRVFRLAAPAILAAMTLSLPIRCAPALASGLTASDLLNAATDLGRRYDANYAARDPEAMALLYATDGVLVSPSGPIVHGRDALKAYYVQRFAGGARSHMIRILEVHVQGNGGYGLAAFSVMVPHGTEGLHEEHGTIVAIYRRDFDGWHLSLVAPSVPPGK